MRIAVYPGSFDPITNGHLEVLRRSISVFDEVILLLAVNPNKKAFFDVGERLQMMNEAVQGLSNVKVDSFDGLTVEYCKKVGARHIVRGLRAVSDFEYEFGLAAANEYCDPSIDMVFFMAHQEKSFISSSMINELASSRVDVSPLVPPAVNAHLVARHGKPLKGR